MELTIKVHMAEILGTYQLTLDAKGRFVLPAGYKKQLQGADNQQFVLNCGIDACVYLYTLSQWEKMESIIVRLNDFNEKARNLKRFLTQGIQYVEPDSAGRILLPSLMLKHAGMTKDIVFTSQLTKVEIWDAETYTEKSRISLQDFNQLSNEVLGSEFTNPFI